MIKKLMIAAFSLLFLATMFGGIFHMTGSMGMDGNMSGCPFMASGESMCSMSASDHLEVWKATFLSVVPTIVLLTTLTFVVFLTATTLPSVFTAKTETVVQFFTYYRQRRYRCSQRSLQELFARGILHPKLF